MSDKSVDTDKVREFLEVEFKRISETFEEIKTEREIYLSQNPGVKSGDERLLHYDRLCICYLGELELLRKMSYSLL